MCTICRTGSPSDGKECKVPGVTLLQKSRGQLQGWALGGNKSLLPMQSTGLGVPSCAELPQCAG